METEVSVPSTKPIMAPEVETAVLDSLVQFQHRDKWKEWGLHKLREQGAAILLEGPPGTGKNTIAKWMARKIKKGFKLLAPGDVAGGEPGESERQIREFFADARRRKNMTVFMDECDALLGDRDKISPDGRTWQLGAIEELMMQINTYPGLIICATNHIQSLDPALADRFIAIVHVDEPDFGMRLRLWKQKLGQIDLPIRLDDAAFKRLSKTELNGRGIENAIVAAASHAMRKGIKPTVGILIQFAELETEKEIVANK